MVKDDFRANMVNVGLKQINLVMTFYEVQLRKLGLSQSS